MSKSIARKAFEFAKTYEEVEIAGNTYKIEFNDEKVLQYSKSFDKFYQDTKKINEIDVTKLTPAEQEEHYKEMQGIVKKVVEELLGNDTYVPLYELSGKSLMNMIEMVEYLSDVVGDKTERIREDRKKKYLVKKK